MNHTAENETRAGLGTFEKTCGYCGARFRVLGTVAKDPLRSQAYEYDCPACGKRYEVQSGAEPEVRLLRGRTDGKDDQYQETMF
ncbi:hypothetical protein [Ramlibacter sp. AN1133]|uniref:hypothetical protein n=1 Tax=Ramlibacter sp. AN1133 TaxID=3133429 RepID=UPI0030BD9F45